jgi:hypothetical protein
MKLSVVLPLAAVAQVTLADFYIHAVNSNTDFGYQISEASEPDCQVLGRNTPWYPLKTDVSKKNLGVRCNGAGCRFGVVRLLCSYNHNQIH